VNMPGFNAESSLVGSSGTYRGNAAFGSPGGIGVLPAQFGPGGFFQTMRCCQWSPIVGRFVCVSRRHTPWQQCRCIRTSTFPVILCDDIVVATEF
jgi:hypothetical protein